MKRLERFLVLTISLAAAGGLAYRFQPDFEPVGYLIFAAAILIGSEIFYRIDKAISIRSQKR